MSDSSNVARVIRRRFGIDLKNITAIIAESTMEVLSADLANADGEDKDGGNAAIED